MINILATQGRITAATLQFANIPLHLLYIFTYNKCFSRTRQDSRRCSLRIYRWILILYIYTFDNILAKQGRITAATLQFANITLHLLLYIYIHYTYDKYFSQTMKANRRDAAVSEYTTSSTYYYIYLHIIDILAKQDRTAAAAVANIPLYLLILYTYNRYLSRTRQDSHSCSLRIYRWIYIFTYNQYFSRTRPDSRRCSLQIYRCIFAQTGETTTWKYSWLLVRETLQNKYVYIL